MISVTVELPDAVHEFLARTAADRETTVERLIAEAVGGEVDLARWQAERDGLERRAARAEAGAMAEILARVPDVPAEPYDRLDDPEPFDRAAFEAMVDGASK
ncbi:hypothetical protein [Alienimonas sp. DA493]|uniref:hypothetical protein n=1 Tax=Alienimonas sp. DA493 TaxID=3373605 RepID=UPI003754BEE0